MKQTTIVKLFQITRQTWTNWKKEERPIVELIEKYFTDEDIEEFINTGICSKLEKKDNISHKNTNIQNEINSKLMNFQKEALLRALRVSLKSIKNDNYTLLEQIEKIKNENSFFEQIIKNLFSKNDDIIALKHFNNLYNLINLSFTQEEMQEIVINKNIYINSITTIIENL